MLLSGTERTIAEFVISNKHLVLDTNAKEFFLGEITKLLQRPGFDFQRKWGIKVYQRLK